MHLYGVYRADLRGLRVDLVQEIHHGPLVGDGYVQASDLFVGENIAQLVDGFQIENIVGAVVEVFGAELVFKVFFGKGIGDVSPDESVFFHFLRFVFSIPAVPAARARFFSLYVSILTVPQKPSRMNATAIHVPGWFRAGR